MPEPKDSPATRQGDDQLAQSDTTDPGDVTGLYGKYEVRKDGTPVESCFVLEPESDPAAREALLRYAEATDNEELADDLREWIAEISTESERDV